jgi:tetratricopeptide (TPR) repeat protein
LKNLAAAPEGEAWQAEPVPGEELDGRFLLTGLLGRGGFGAVFKAYDKKLGRDVAVKAVRTGARGALRQERLQLEAEAAARLSHPNIVTLFDLGSCEHGPYLVLELLRGESLGARLERGPLPPAEALRVATEVARGLAHAHARGVIHRDLKPLNVFLCEDGAVKLLDFGLAHAFGHRLASGGTPAYMPPEQRSGAPEDERTDVFALGVMLHEMLSGAPPFDPEASPRHVRPAPRLEVEGLPALGEFVARMVALDPLARPRDGAEALEALVAIAPATGGAAAPSGTVPAVRARRRRRVDRRVLVAAAAGVAVASAAYVVGRVLVPARPGASTGPIVAVADVANVPRDPELDAISGLLLTAIEQSPRLRVLPRTRLVDLSDREGGRPPARIDEHQGRRAARRARADVLVLTRVVRLDDVYVVEVRGVDPASDERRFSFTDQEPGKGNLLKLLDRAGERVRLALGEPPATIKERAIAAEAVTASLDAWRRYQDGMACFERRSFAGSFKECLEHFQSAVAIDPGFALAHLQTSFLHFLQGSPRALQKGSLARALEHEDRLPPSARLRMLGMSAFLDGRDLDAKRLLVQAADAAPDDKYAWWYAAEVPYHRDELAEALPLLRRVHELDPTWTAVVRHLAIALWASGGTDDLAALAAALEARGDAPESLLALCTAAPWLSPGLAVDACERARAAGGGEEADRLLAIALLAQGDRAALGVHLSRMAERSRPPSFDWYMSLWLRAQEGRWPEVVRAVAEAGDPDDSWQHATFAEMLAGTGDADRTRRTALRILELDRALVTNVAVYLAYQGDLARAAEFAPYLPPGSPRVKAYEAMVRWRRGDLAAAIDLLSDVAAVAPLSADPPIPPPLYLLGEALSDAGRDAEAVEALRRFGAMPMTYPSWFKPRARYHLARCLERMGDVQGARAEIRELLALWARASPEQPLLGEARALGARLGVR